MGLDKNKPFPKRPRLKNFDYEGSFIYSVTILTRGKQNLFDAQEKVNLVFGILRETASGKEFSILAYCFMPDHLHLLLAGKTGDADLQKFISLFKQKSGYEFKKTYNKKLWHLSYYDHILRRDEDVLTTARYILNNPVRKGLVDNFKDYPCSGSLVFDLKDL